MMLRRILPPESKCRPPKSAIGVQINEIAEEKWKNGISVCAFPSIQKSAESLDPRKPRRVKNGQINQSIETIAIVDNDTKKKPVSHHSYSPVENCSK
jgi:hypothetical protein